MAWTTPATATAGSTALTAAFWNEQVRDNTQQLFDQDGLIMIRPTSVAGTGVTLSNGKVSFSAASTISVNGCFSSSYDNYRIVISTTAGSTSALFQMRMRAAGTDASGASTYSYSLLQSASSGSWIVLDFSSGTTSHTVGYKQTANRASSSIDVYGPFEATQTGLSITGHYASVPYTGGGYHTVASSYDGFSILAATGDMTGSLRVYGYRNS